MNEFCSYFLAEKLGMRCEKHAENHRKTLNRLKRQTLCLMHSKQLSATKTANTF